MGFFDIFFTNLFQDIIQLDDPSTLMKKRGAYDEGDYTAPKRDGEEGEEEEIGELGEGLKVEEEEGSEEAKLIEKMEPSEMKDFDPSKRSKFDDDSFSESESISGDTLGYGVDGALPSIQVTSVDDISSKRQAKKVLQMQRHKLGVTGEITGDGGPVIMEKLSPVNIKDGAGVDGLPSLQINGLDSMNDARNVNGVLSEKVSQSI